MYKFFNKINIKITDKLVENNKIARLLFVATSKKYSDWRNQHLIWCKNSKSHSFFEGMKIRRYCQYRYNQAQMNQQNEIEKIGAKANVIN